jgi:predicted DNA-binding transcriptional regulator YafY
VAPTGSPARRPHDFDLDDYIAKGALNFGSGERIRLEALISEDLAWILAETQLAADQVLEPEEDRVKLRATVLDGWQLKWWILGQGSRIIVEQPEWLREEVRDEVGRMLVEYELRK